MKTDQVGTPTPSLREWPALVIHELLERTRLLVDAVRGIDAETPEPLDELFPSEPAAGARLKARG